MSSRSTRPVFVFTSAGLGHTDNIALKISLAQKLLTLLASSEPLPSQICFYTDGVRLCLHGSPVLDELRALADLGVELVLCSTCLDTLGLRDQVAVGVIGGMGDIITAMMHAGNTISL